MARSNGSARIAWLMSAALAALLALPGPWLHVQAQGTPHQRAKSLLEDGINAYMQHDFERADLLLHQAQGQAADLLESERADLENYLTRNTGALQGRREGVRLLHELERALAEGRDQDAIDLEKKLRLHRDNLGPTDRDKATQLLDRVRARAAFAAPEPAGNGKAAALARLKQGRGLLGQCDFEGAERIAAEVEAMHVSFGLIDDNPRKLREDIKLARDDAKFYLNAARDAFKHSDLERAEHLAREANAKAKLTSFPLWMDSPNKLLKEIEQARAHAAAPKPAERKDAAASTPVVQASASASIGTGANFPPPVPPMGAPPPSPAGAAGANGVLSADAAAKRAEASKRALEMMRGARKALADGNFAVAEQWAMIVHDLGPDTRGWPEDLKPDAVLADVRRAKVAKGLISPDIKTAAAPTGKEDPRVLMKQAHDLYEAAKYDEAEALAKRARTAKVTWGFFAENPDSLLNKIAKARASRDKEDSTRVLAEARKELEKGNFDQAEKLACKAQQMHGEYPIYYLGDQPCKVQADIVVARHKHEGQNVPQLPADLAHQQAQPEGPAQPRPTNVVRNPPSGPMQLPPSRTGPDAVLPGPTGPGYPGVPNPALVQGTDLRTPPWNPNAPAAPAPDPRQRVMALLQQGKALEAQDKLIEAKQCYEEARRCMGPPAPYQDDPTLWAMTMLRNTAYREVKVVVDGAAEAMRTSQRDPARCQKMLEDLGHVREIALAFQLDVLDVDAKVQWVSAARAGTYVAEPLGLPVIPGIPESDPGPQLVRQGYVALRRGDLAAARIAARNAYNDPTVRRWAQELLQRIDDEELNQRRLTESRNYDAGIDRYRQKDFAAAFGILSQVNPHMLDGSRQLALREILNSPEMHSRVMQVKDQQLVPAATEGIGQRTVADHLPPSGVMESDILKHAEMMQDLKFQKLMADSREVQSSAIKLFQQGEEDRALEVLKAFRDQLNNEQDMSLQKLAVLRRPIESRIQNFNTLKAQVEFEKHRKDSDTISYGDRPQHELAKKLEEKQVAELMSQFDNFYRSYKYADAERVASLAATLEPDNPATQAAYKMARQQVRMERDKQLSKRKENFDYNALYDVEDLGDYPGDKNPLKIDPDFERRTKNRMDPSKGIAIGNLKPIEKEIEQKLYSPAPNISWKNQPLEKAVEDLKNWEGINVLLDREALKQENINPQAPLDFEIGNGASLQSALNLMLGQLKLTYVIQNEALVITTERQAQGKMVRKVFEVAGLITPHNQPATPPGQIPGLTPIAPNIPDNGPAPVISNSSGLPVGSSSGSEGWKSDKKQVTNTLEQELIRLITGTIQRDSWCTYGGPGTIEYYPIGSALVVNQTPDIIDQVHDLLDALRRLQDVEVSVELRIVSVADNFFERIGVDFSANFLLDNKKFQPQLLSGVYAPPGYVNNFQPNGFLAGLQQPGVFTTDLNLPIASNSFGATPIPSFGFPGAGAAGGGLNVGLAFLSEVQLYFFLQAVQYDERNHIMQAPKLMMFNGQTGNLTVGANQLLMTGLTVQNLNGQIVVTPTITSAASNVTLSLTPIVSADRRFVRLDIAQTMTNLSPVLALMPITMSITPTLLTNQGLVNPVLFTNFIQLPTFDTLTVNTSVNVPDGGTVVMGGFKRMAEGRNEAGPPILGKIPYLDRLFRNVSYGRQSEHLIMLVTPRIIITEEEERLATGVINPLAGGGIVPP